MKRLVFLSAIIFALISCDQRDSRVTTIDDILTTFPPGEELKCTGGTKKTCTSKFAFVCPAGWSACPLTDGNKTCCKQN